MKSRVRTERAPAPKGAYSQGIIAATHLLYVAAQGPFDPETGRVVSSEFALQAEQVFKNIGAIVEAAGAAMVDVVQVNVYLGDPENFAEMNEVFARHFPEPYPARTPVITPVYLAHIMADAVVAIPREEKE